MAPNDANANAGKTRSQKKTAAPATASHQVPSINPASSFTPENFERDLKALAAKAKHETWTKYLSEQAAVYSAAALVLILAAACCTASQLALSPVYGAIPAARWHAKLVAAACFVGWSLNLVLGRALPFRPAALLPVVALYVPAVQFALERVSGALTAYWGPLVTEAVTLFPLVTLSAACVATYLDGADLRFLPRWMADAAPGLGSYGFFKAAEAVSAPLLRAHAGRTALTTRIGLETALAASYSLFVPSKLLVWAVPALLHTAVWNPHAPTAIALARVNGTLAAQEWLILDRRESVTGYVSVVESVKEGYRLMRCDHSLLGGEWVKFIGMGQFKGNQVAEPVYAVFAMLEAVRLVEMPAPVADSDAKALVM